MEADLTKANLAQANLSGANLAEADLSRADLSGANLTNANLRGANLEKANLQRANLEGADLTNTYLKEAQVSPAQLTRARVLDEADEATSPKNNPQRKWREFFAHLGPYIMTIGALGIINALTSPDFPWFFFPAAGWGIGLSIHFWTVLFGSIPGLSRKWRNFLNHLASYISVIGALGIVNAIVSPEFPWFLFPAAAWGIGLGSHFWTVLIGGGDKEEVKVKAKIELSPRVEQRPAARPAAQPAARPAAQPPLAAKRRLASKTLQVNLDKALAYRQEIERMLAATSDQIASTRMQELAQQVAEWTAAVEDLAWRVDRFQQDPLIRHDLETVPQALKELENRLGSETNAGNRTELERTLTNRKNQMAALKRLQGTMRRAEIQIESTMSALGTIYSQILTGQSTDHVADYSRLSAEVDEEVRTLQDQLEALEEVKLGRG